MRSGVLRLRQRRLARPPGPERHPAGGRARGHHQSPLQEQPRRHLHRRHGEGGTDAAGLGVRGHGRRLRQRRLRGPLSHLLRPQRAVPQQRRRHLHRRDREGRPRRGTRALRLRLHVVGLRPRRAPRPLRRLLPRHHPGEAAPARREPGLPLEGRARELRAAWPAHGVRAPLPQQRRRHVHGREQGLRGRRRLGLLSHDRGRRRLRQRRLARHLRRLRLHAELALPQPARRHLRPGRARARRGLERRRSGAGGHGGRRRRLRPRRQPGHLQDPLLRRHERALPERR